MSEDSINNNSKSDWEAIEKMSDEDIDLSDIPEISEEQMARAVKYVAGQPVERGKTRINMYLDKEIVAYFKEKAGGRGYQTLINDTLREVMYTIDLESKLRRIIREELSNDYKTNSNDDLRMTSDE